MEKNKAQCINGHWFDVDKFSVCPHCGEKKRTGEVTVSQELSISLETETSDKAKKKGLFWSKREKNKETEIRTTGGVSETAASISSVGLTCGNSVTHSTNPNPKEEPINPEMFEGENLPRTEVLIKTLGQMTEPAVEDVEIKKKEFQTVAPVKRDIDDIKTISIYATEQGVEPVTGWLVGVRGEYKGSSFQLKAGMNVIGRSADAYVSLKKDTQVSRGKHAVIIYDPKKKEFYLGAGEELTYCNDNRVCGEQELKPYDLIEIGGGSYMFIPFCGEQFDWDKE